MLSELPAWVSWLNPGLTKPRTIKTTSQRGGNTIPAKASRRVVDRCASFMKLTPTKPFLRYFLDGPFRQLERKADSQRAADMQKVLLQIRVVASPDKDLGEE